jgi:hypothetical protein
LREREKKKKKVWTILPFKVIQSPTMAFDVFLDILVLGEYKIDSK